MNDLMNSSKNKKIETFKELQIAQINCKTLNSIVNNLCIKKLKDKKEYVFAKNGGHFMRKRYWNKK